MTDGMARTVLRRALPLELTLRAGEPPGAAGTGNRLGHHVDRLLAHRALGTLVRHEQSDQAWEEGHTGIILRPSVGRSSVT